jgi:type IV secretion system protein VirB1
MDFLAFAAECGPSVHPTTTAAIVRVESNYNPLVIRDNTLKRSFYPKTRSEAERLATSLHNNGNKLAIGLMQVTTPWLRRFNITPSTLLDPCQNVYYGTAILSKNYADLLPSSSSRFDALNRAMSAYWSGRPDNGGAYVNQVYSHAGSVVRVRETPGVTDGVLRSKASNSPATSTKNDSTTSRWRSMYSLTGYRSRRDSAR